MQGGLCRSPVYLCRNCSSAAFSSRETCAWLMPISRATSIWVSPGCHRCSLIGLSGWVSPVTGCRYSNPLIQLSSLSGART
mgnify:CR=1 FL=1